MGGQVACSECENSQMCMAALANAMSLKSARIEQQSASAQQSVCAQQSACAQPRLESIAPPKTDPPRIPCAAPRRRQTRTQPRLSFAGTLGSSICRKPFAFVGPCAGTLDSHAPGKHCVSGVSMHGYVSAVSEHGYVSTLSSGLVQQFPVCAGRAGQSSLAHLSTAISGKISNRQPRSPPYPRASQNLCQPQPPSLCHSHHFWSYGGAGARAGQGNEPQQKIHAGKRLGIEKSLTGAVPLNQALSSHSRAS
eukprot:6180729-Pleurochrysis_carterae.AAC.3